MKILIAIFRCFPYGGLQKDFLKIAGELLRRGHQVVCACMEWEGPQPPEGLEVRLIPRKGWTSHARAIHFEKQVQKILSHEDFDCSLTMNRVGGFDFYFAADNCFSLEAQKRRGANLRNLLPRYRTFMHLEKEIFSPESQTRIFIITEHQKTDFQQVYHTPDDRLIMLPPGMNPGCRLPESWKISDIRRKIRQEFHLPENTFLLIQIASSPWTKGADRTVHALYELEQTAKGNLPPSWKYLLAGPAEP